MVIRVLSIEIGYGLTKVVEMDYQVKKEKIYHCFSFETPKDMFNDGMVMKNDLFCSILKEECAIRGIKTDKVVFSITSSRIASREVTIPVVKSNRIYDVIKANASEYFPVDIGQYQLGYSILGKIEDAEGKRLKLSVLAAPLDLLKSYYEVAESCGLTVAGLDYVGNSVFQVVRHSFKEGVNLVIKIEERSSMVTILKDNEIALQRNIPYGIHEAIETLMESSAYGENLSYKDAIDIFRRKTCIRRHLDVESGYKEEEDERPDIARTRADITETLRYVIGNISRVMDYYSSRNSEDEFTKIVLVGLGAEFSGLTKLLSNELDKKVVVFAEHEAKFHTTADGEPVHLHEYIACIGAAIGTPAIQYEQAKKKKPSESVAYRNRSMAGTILTGICALVIIGLLSASFIPYMIIKKSNEKLETEIASYQYAKDINDAYLAAQVTYDETQTANTLMASPNNYLINFIGELEEKMPTEMNALTFSSTGEGVTMNVTVSSKTAAAVLVNQLRSFVSLQNLTMSAISQATDEAGISTVSFTVQAGYSDDFIHGVDIEESNETFEEGAE